MVADPPLARGRAGNDFLYWETMRRAADRGCTLFDFGRSKIGTGSYRVQAQLGLRGRSAALPLSAESRRNDPRPQSAQPEIPLVHRGLETPAAAGGECNRAFHRAWDWLIDDGATRPNAKASAFGHAGAIRSSTATLCCSVCRARNRHQDCRHCLTFCFWRNACPIRRPKAKRSEHFRR